MYCFLLLVHAISIFTLGSTDDLELLREGKKGSKFVNCEVDVYIALAESNGKDTEFVIPAIGTFGVGNADSKLAKFTPDRSASDPNEGTFLEERLSGYDNSNTAGGMKRSRSGFLSLSGLGTFDVGKSDEKGTGLTNIADTISSFILPYSLASKIEKFADNQNSRKAEFDGIDLSDPVSPATSSSTKPADGDYGEELDLSKISEQNTEPTESRETEKNLAVSEHEKKPSSPFDQIKERLDLPLESPSSNTMFEGSSEQSGKDDMMFIDKLKNTKAFHTAIFPQKSAQAFHIPLSKLGLKPEEIETLCKKFEPIAAEYCYAQKIDEKFVEKCRGYTEDCVLRKNLNKPLGAIANAFSSSVGVTYNNWGINGIPYYGINDEGTADGGHNGKISFGSWGGGYSDGVNVRDYFTQTADSGGNWYEGLYGYKTGWSVPIASEYGIEGGGGTQVQVPLKEGRAGSPLGYMTGYHVGPYIGVSNGVGVDWFNGAVSSRKAFASPLVGVSGSSGTSFAFPSISTFMKGLGLSRQFGSSSDASPLQIPADNEELHSEH